MQTSNGTQVKNLQFIDSAKIYVGEVNGKLLTWKSNGRRSEQRRSKFDLALSQEYFVVIKKWGSRYLVSPKLHTEKEARKNLKNVVEIVKVDICL